MIHGITFVRIPKNASTSIYQALGKANTIRDDRLYPFMWRNVPRYKGLFAPSHCLLSEAITELGAKICRVPSFAVVRNPYERMVSMYGYAKKHDLFYLYGHRRLSFRDFCAAFEKLAIEDKHFFHAYSQLRFVTIEDGSESKIAVDRVLRFESLAAQFKEFVLDYEFDKRAVSLALPHLNASKHEPYDDYYCPRSQGVIERVWGEDLDAFGYKF
jgi:hypothetical protein